MAQYCDNFKFSETNDSFQFWQGLRGPYFTPFVDEAGNLSWTNNGGLPNPETKNIQGKGIQLSGYAESIEELPEDPQRGDAWAVGTEEPFECFAWFGEWVDLGPMFPPGPPGQDGQDGQGVPAGGAAGQFLRKKSAEDYDAEWYSPAAGDVSFDSSLTYEAGTVGQELSSQRNTLNQFVRPNLLDNWYFVGGGSQAGNGKFPINQRAQTSYGASQYSVDRWYNGSGGTGVAVVSSDGGYLTLTSGTILSQKIVKPFTSAKLTMTVFGISGDLTTGTAEFTGSTTPVTFVIANNFQLYMADDGAGNIIFYIAAFATLGIKAVKVEIGDTQTLAHQENGQWVLNEIPNYGEELAKCQRYYYKTPTAYSAIMLPVTNSILVNSVNFPVQMIDTPHTVAITSIMPSNSITPITPSGTIGHIESPVSLSFISSTASDFSTDVPGYFVQFTASADL